MTTSATEPWGEAFDTFDTFDTIYRVVDGTELHARVYRPVRPGPCPIIVDVHGGVWNGGDRSTDATIDAALAARGITVVAVDVRQAPEHTHPSSLDDVVAAVSWVAAHACDLNGSADCVGALGVSSGGHLVLLAALATGTGQLLDHLVLCWPVADPARRYDWAVSTGRTALVEKHDRYWTARERMVLASPQRLLDEELALPALPPALLVYGSADGNVPESFTRRFIESYRARGGSLTVERYTGAPHGFIGVDPSMPSSVHARGVIADYVLSRATAAVDDRARR